jgi:hypothetical protein
MMTAPHRLSRADTLIVARIETAIPAPATARSLADRFADLVCTGRAEDLPDWLSEAGPSPLASSAPACHHTVQGCTRSESGPKLRTETPPVGCGDRGRMGPGHDARQFGVRLLFGQPATGSAIRGG